MNSWWKGVRNMLGYRSARPPSEDEEAEKQRSLQEAKERVEMLSIRVDVIARRLRAHEQKPKHQ